MCITCEYLLKYLYDNTNGDCYYGMATVTDNTHWIDQLAERTHYT